MPSVVHALSADTLSFVFTMSRYNVKPAILRSRQGHVRNVSMASMNALNTKREGDISDAFASMSGKKVEPLPDRFRELKLSLSNGYEDQIIAGWGRLLQAIKIENDVIVKRGPSIIPNIRFSHLHEDLAAKKEDVIKRGAAVIRGVIPEKEARNYKFEIEEYVRRNPHTKGFPQGNPQVIELYWSKPQMQARTHPNLLSVQAELMRQVWHASPGAPVSYQPLSYADRLRIRQPGDARFALGPHQDGGSVERWERDGYGDVYSSIFKGEWEKYDAYDATHRVHAVTNLYNGLGACSMFRMFQGWLSMSHVGPEQGTLLVYPSVKESAAYALLRPFFRPVKGLHQGSKEDYLDEHNWKFTAGPEMTSDLQGATPGHGMEFPEGMHPHLELDRTMVHVPEVKPGDLVVWHCDLIHAVDKRHNGASDSSVLYIPVCPTTESNARYLAMQRAAFIDGTPAPDFPGGMGESQHLGRPTLEYMHGSTTSAGLQTLGLQRLEVQDGETSGAREAVEQANVALGFETEH